MRFEVPQFVDIEDKIFGPLTLKQFIYLVGGAGGSFVLYKLLPAFLGYIFASLIVVFSLALAFYKPGNIPFIKVMESAFTFAFSDKLYIWKKRPHKKKQGGEKEDDVVAQINVPRLSDSKLSDLSWSLDIKEKLGE